jgi:predicted AlkP superfamily pyrophosphatase or phosphodiesterase
MGQRPTYWKKFDSKLSLNDRVKQVLEWLDLGVDKRPQFVSLYFEDTDTAGHKFGPKSAGMKEAVMRVDEAIGTLEEGLKARGLLANTDLVVVSDHGMTWVNPKKIFYFNLNPTEALVVGYGPLTGLWPHGNEELLLKRLQNISPLIHCSRKQDLPDQARLHYFNHKRIPPLLCLAEEHAFLIITNGKKPDSTPKGAHGYDNKYDSMHGIFFAQGPNFRSGTQLKVVENLDVEPLLEHLLGLRNQAPAVFKDVLQ